MRPTYGASKCVVRGVPNANMAAMQKHTLAAHQRLDQNANRRMPRQVGPGPALGGAAVAVSSSPGETTPAPVRAPPQADPFAGLSPVISTVIDGMLHAGPARHVRAKVRMTAADAPASNDGVFGEIDNCDKDDAELLLQLSEDAKAQAAQEEHNDWGKPPQSAQSMVGDLFHVQNFSSVSTKAQAECERIGSSKRCEPAVDARPNRNPGRYNTPALQTLQTFAKNGNGSGLQTVFQNGLYHLLSKWDGSDGSSKPGAHVKNRIGDVFSSATAFRNAVCDDLDDAILASGWKKCTLLQGGVIYNTYFLSALNTALEALRNAKKEELRRDDGKVGDRRQAPVDGEEVKAYQNTIDGTAFDKAFLLSLYVYSDASLLSWSGGTCLLFSIACMLSGCPSSFAVPPCASGAR